MERVRLGRSDLEVTRLCLGTWNMDGSQGWGPQSDDESIELIRKVLDTGCNFVDTAHARVVDAVADEIGATSSQVTLAWCLATPGITAPIVGISRMAQWEENLGSLEVALTDEQYRAVSEAGLRVWRALPDDASMWG